MEAALGFLGWTIVAATGVAYLWVFYRIVLFPKQPGTPSGKHETRRAA